MGKTSAFKASFEKNRHHAGSTTPSAHCRASFDLAVPILVVGIVGIFVVLTPASSSSVVFMKSLPCLLLLFVKTYYFVFLENKSILMCFFMFLTFFCVFLKINVFESVTSSLDLVTSSLDWISCNAQKCAWCWAFTRWQGSVRSGC